jgi:predicted dehydrogenase/flavin reductase (DIM6/NTAB) family NADH-FMN oxidoreductase RutF
MLWPGRTIWDTRVQGVSGIISVVGEHGVEIYFSASFAQLSLDPPRVIVNPNRMYAIEAAIKKRRRFAINVLAQSQCLTAIRLMRMRRRQLGKAKLLALDLGDHDGIPFLADCLQNIFCEIETEIPTGDRNLYIARVLESRINALRVGELPLLFSQVTTPISRFPMLRRTMKTAATLTGALDLIKKLLLRLRPPATASIAQNTYDEAGATETELELIRSQGLSDTSRYLVPPTPPAILRKRIGVCVVGTGWGSFHCRLVRKADPSARLFVCGRNADRASRVAKAFNADAYFTSLEEAAHDSRIQAFTLALPHDLHRSAVETVASAGKHALVEKPIATNLADADAMISAARSRRTILMVAEDMHFRPAVREAVMRIEKGDLGEPLYLLAHAGGIRKPRGWAADEERMGGGVLIDIGVHYIRGLRLLMGEPDQVFASRAMQIDTRIGGEDSIQLLFSSRIGWQAHMLLSWATQRGNLPDIVVVGDSGTFHLWAGASFLDYFPVEPRPLTRALSLVRPDWLREKLSSPSQQRMRINLSDQDTTGYVDEFREFLSAVGDHRPPVTAPEDGRRDLEIVLTAYASLATGTVTRIPDRRA